jgi:hypothetical protein
MTLMATTISEKKIKEKKQAHPFSYRGHLQNHYIKEGKRGEAKLPTSSGRAFWLFK